MLLAMLAFVRVPDDVDQTFPGGQQWYIFAVFMHTILALVTFSVYITTVDTLETVRAGAQMIAVLAEILNFTTMLTIFANSKDWEDMTDQEKKFCMWILVEAIMVITTVFANMLFVMIRSCRKIQITVPLDHQLQSAEIVQKDFNKDFLAVEENQFWINLVNQSLGPLLIQIFLYYYFKGDKEGSLNDQEVSILFVQLGFQAVQWFCLLYTMTVPPVPKICGKALPYFKYITWLATISFYIIVPICAVFHWVLFISVTVSKTNVVSSYMFCYPMMCLLTMGFYFLLIKHFVQYLKEELYNDDMQKKPQRCHRDLLDIYEEVGEEKEAEEEATCFSKLIASFTGGDPSKTYIEPEIKYKKVSNEAAIYRIIRSYERSAKNIENPVSLDSIKCMSDGWEQNYQDDSFIQSCYEAIKTLHKANSKENLDQLIAECVQKIKLGDREFQFDEIFQTIEQIEEELPQEDRGEEAAEEEQKEGGEQEQEPQAEDGEEQQSFDEDELSSSDSDEEDDDDFAKSQLSIRTKDGLLGFIISRTNYFLVLTQYDPSAKVNNSNDEESGKQKYFSAKAVYDKCQSLREEESSRSYLEQMRIPGSGPLRLNSKLNMREDLYSFLFITCIHAEYIREAQKKHEKEEQLKEAAIEHYKEKQNPHWKKFDSKAAADFMPQGKSLAAALMQGAIFKAFKKEEKLASARGSAKGSARGSAKGSARGLFAKKPDSELSSDNEGEQTEEGKEQEGENDEEEDDGIEIESETQIADNIKESSDEEEEEEDEADKEAEGEEEGEDYEEEPELTELREHQI